MPIGTTDFQRPKSSPAHSGQTRISPSDSPSACAGAPSRHGGRTTTRQTREVHARRVRAMAAKAAAQEVQQEGKRTGKLLRDGPPADTPALFTCGKDGHRQLLFRRSGKWQSQPAFILRLRGSEV